MSLAGFIYWTAPAKKQLADEISIDKIAITIG
jgi:hypothetical protein